VALLAGCSSEEPAGVSAPTGSTDATPAGSPANPCELLTAVAELAIARI
jgi:hypothetical protein